MRTYQYILTGLTACSAELLFSDWLTVTTECVLIGVSASCLIALLALFYI